MKPSLVDCTRWCAEPALVEPGATVANLLAELAARMTVEQRGALLAKMAMMDRERELTTTSVTLGRA